MFLLLSTVGPHPLLLRVLIFDTHFHFLPAYNGKKSSKNTGTSGFSIYVARLQKVVKHPPFPLLSENSGCLSCHLSKTSSSKLDRTSPTSFKDIWTPIHSTISQQSTLVHGYRSIPLSFSKLSFKDLLLVFSPRFTASLCFGRHLHWQFLCGVEV